uniref:Uncharacterized protein n=1 Tax=Dulem virus 59 TaxID=3145770 RepID=A0AAU8B8W0_9VIRU
MLGDLLVWILKSSNSIIGVMKKFELGGGLNFFSLLFCIAAIRILLLLLDHIRADKLADENFVKNMKRYDEYKKNKEDN